MKHISFYLFAFLFFFCTSCEEVCPKLNVDDDNGPPIAGQQRQVLIEEFTGIRCVNCPAGSQAIEVLIDQHEEQLIAVSIHAGFFAQPPFPETQQDLATSEGASLLSYLGEPNGYPAAVVNRKLFSGEEILAIAQSSWPGYIAQELAEAPAVEVDLMPQYNTASRELSLAVDLLVLENVNEDDIRLSVFITENNIIDAQQTPDGQQNDYVHKHVLRGVLSAVQGDLLSESFTVNAQISRTFTFTLPEIWNAENCHVIGFVHLGGENKDVLQAHEVSIQ